ncbi:leishmanolysin-related zinc metalloendopeptidase [Deinococcus misasensis]|uniref:leishmanolysin-related zinc metalloendopeptidase n=1 Tax=Deinococcus misasensis TaxID=392413 RepID=UPI000690F129|nr:leishmanolysin-related zinc metalloendopeptidase [Deinococcus misasensis]
MQIIDAFSKNPPEIFDVPCPTLDPHKECPLKHLWTFAAAVLVVACNAPAALPQEKTEKTHPTLLPAHLVEFEFQQLNTPQPTSTVKMLTSGVSKQNLRVVDSGLVFQALSNSTFTVRRTGIRYLNAAYRVTNNTGRTLHNLTFVGVNLDDLDGNPSNNTTQPTPSDTIFRSVKFYDGTDASSKAHVLVPGPLYEYDYQNDAPRPVSEGARFRDGLDVEFFFPEAPTGLSLEPKPLGWTLDGEFYPGQSKILTFSVKFPMAATPAQDPFSFSVIASYAEDLDLPEPYNIQVTHPAGTLLSSSQKALFESAARRWEGVIQAGLQDFTDFDVGGGRILNVDDLEISVSAVNMDGVGGILGRAGPEYVRPRTELPITGIMQFDVADLAQMEASGTLENVILHEMGHVLGIGTLYKWDELLSHNGGLDCLQATSVVFGGAQAMQQHAALGGSGPVPVEDQYGAGTQCGHWQEARFDHELMTGFVENGPMPLSTLTVGALQDLGYQVNLNAADAYTLPSLIKQGMDVHGMEIKEEFLRPKPLPVQ